MRAVVVRISSNGSFSVLPSPARRSPTRLSGCGDGARTRDSLRRRRVGKSHQMPNWVPNWVSDIRMSGWGSYAEPHA